jgi:hypothetical protein
MYSIRDEEEENSTTMNGKKSCRWNAHIAENHENRFPFEITMTRTLVYQSRLNWMTIDCQKEIDESKNGEKIDDEYILLSTHSPVSPNRCQDWQCWNPRSCKSLV